MTQRSVPVVGFVGGIGAGKSTLSHWLGERLRIVVLDADRVGHEVLTQQEVQEQIRSRFGADILDAAGTVSRPQLAARVFGDSAAHRQARTSLEEIVHPRIADRLEAAVAQLRRHAACDLIVLDAAVMLESRWSHLCDLILFLDAPYEQRLARVGRSRGWSAEDLQRREQSQWPLDQKRAAADAVLSTAGSVDAAGEQLMQILRTRFPSLLAAEAGGVSERAGQVNEAS